MSAFGGKADMIELCELPTTIAELRQANAGRDAVDLPNPIARH